MPIDFQNITITGGLQLVSAGAAPPSGDAYWANVSYLSETASTNTQTNNVFLDSSSSPKTLTVTGTLTQGTFSPFTLTSGSSYSPSVNGGSGLFSGGQLSFTQQSISGDFTAECWFYRTGNAAGYSLIFGGDGSTGGAANCQLYVQNDGSVRLLLSGAVIITSASTPVTTNAWHHIAWVRSGSSCAIFVDGTRVGTGTSSANLIYQVISSMAGLGGIISNYYAQGYLSSCRVVNAAVYNPANSTLTVPTAPLTAISGTSILMNFTNAGMYDATTISNLTGFGTAQASTTQAKWSPTSAYFNGSASYLYAQPNTAFALGTGDFTVECWVYMNSLTPGGSGTNVPFCQSDAVGSSTSNKWFFCCDTTYLYFAGHAGGGYILTPFSPATGTWYHVAVTRASGTARMFVNGVSGAVTPGNGGIGSYNLDQNGLAVGGMSTPAYLNGYIQDLRLTKGVARYTATFTPPTAPFPTSA
jgi:hypothetical protein